MNRDSIALLSVGPDEHAPDMQDAWVFRVIEPLARHAMKWVHEYILTFVDPATGLLPPTSALADVDNNANYAWAFTNFGCSMDVHLLDNGEWRLRVIFDQPMPFEERDPQQWIDVLWALKKVSRMEFK